MDKNFKSELEIVLVDSFSEYEKIFPYLKEKCVYAFDYDSHQDLKTKNISHQLSEEFLTKDDLKNIQKDVYKFSFWYEYSDFQEFLTYEGMNIGKLFHEEFLDYCVQFFKKYYEIHSLIQKFPNAKFFAGGELFNILNLFTDNNQEIKFQEKNFSFTHDKVRFSIPIGSKSFSIHMPFSAYKTIKNFSEKIIQFNSNKNDESTTLLVEFNTIRYSTILQSSKDYDVPLSLFGLRRPAIWNLETYKIIKNSNCQIITQNSLLDRNIDASNNKKIIENKLIQLFRMKEFEKYFTLFGINFHILIEKILRNLIFERIDSVIRDIKTVNSLFTKHKLKSIILLSEVGYTEQLILNFALKNKIPTIMLHLGLHYDTLEAKEMNNSQSVYPKLSQKFLVWGDIVKKDAITRGEVSEEKITITGNPRFDNYQNLDNKRREYVLLATSGPQHEDVNGLLIKNLENYEKAISEICKVVSSSGRKLVIKLHPSIKEHDITNIAKSIDSEISIFKEGEIFPLIQNCSCMIVMGLSTSIIEAQLLEKPVISIPVIDYKLGNPSVFTSDSCIISDTSELAEYLNKLDNEEFRKKIISRANTFLDLYVENRKNATQVFFNSI